MRMYYLNNYKVIKFFKYIIGEGIFKSLTFYAKKKKYNKNPKKIKRLFVTTGNISLINALTLISQLNKELSSTEFEDYLIIVSPNGTKTFWDQNVKVAKIHNFKKIRLFYKVKFKYEFVMSQFIDFDKIYTVNIPEFIKHLIPLYPNSEYNLIDEGIGSLINYDLVQIPNFNKFYTHKYLQKFDALGFNEIFVKNNITNLDINIFRSLASKIEYFYPLDKSIFQIKKSILYCSIYWTVTGLSKDEFIKQQLLLINNLIGAGYHILYKPHPRDTEFYGIDNNKNVTIVKSVLPAELYNWDVLAVVTMCSSSSINLAHYHNLPCFSNILAETITTEKAWISLNRYLVKEYTPPYQKLLELDVINTDVEILREKIKEIYNDYILKTPLLSKNINLISCYKEIKNGSR